MQFPVEQFQKSTPSFDTYGVGSSLHKFESKRSAVKDPFHDINYICPQFLIQIGLSLFVDLLEGNYACKYFWISIWQLCIFLQQLTHIWQILFKHNQSTKHKPNRFFTFVMLWLTYYFQSFGSQKEVINNTGQILQSNNKK